MSEVIIKKNDIIMKKNTIFHFFKKYHKKDRTKICIIALDIFFHFSFYFF